MSLAKPAINWSHVTGKRHRDSDPWRYFGNSGMGCSRKQAPDALPAGMCLTEPANWGRS